MPTSLVSTGVQFPDSTTQTTALPAPGTNGNVLTSNGSAWTSSAPAGGGSLILVQTVSGSGVDTVDLTSGLNSTYRVYKLYIQVAFSSSSTLYFRFYINGTLNTASTYFYSNHYTLYAGDTPRARAGSASNYAAPGQSGTSQLWEITIFNPSNQQYRQAMYFLGTSSIDVGGETAWGWMGDQLGGTSSTRSLTGIRATSLGNNGTWTMKLYGIKD